MSRELALVLPGLREPRSVKRGVLPYQNLGALLASGYISSPGGVEESQIQPASIDLRLGDSAFQVRASLLPGPDSTVREAIDSLIEEEISLREGALLQKGAVYVVPLLEEMSLPARSTLFAKANPKSTTGRLDIFARLITDRTDRFDYVRRGYKGPLFVEVAPRTFSVRVRTGMPLNQLRFLQGVKVNADASLRASAADSLTYSPSGERLQSFVEGGLWFSVDLVGNPLDETIGWRARKHAPSIDLSKLRYYDPEPFWERVLRRDADPLILAPEEFYILGSREHVRIPPAFAAQMTPYDPAMGEFRVHYAGFFDPGFGYGVGGEIEGTRAILEVRSYEVPYALRHGQPVGRLVYENLLAPPTKLYGEGAGSSYQDQHSGLAKQFRL